MTPARRLSSTVRALDGWGVSDARHGGAGPCPEGAARGARPRRGEQASGRAGGRRPREGEGREGSPYRVHGWGRAGAGSDACRGGGGPLVGRAPAARALRERAGGRGGLWAPPAAAPSRPRTPPGLGPPFASPSPRGGASKQGYFPACAAPLWRRSERGNRLEGAGPPQSRPRGGGGGAGEVRIEGCRGPASRVGTVGLATEDTVGVQPDSGHKGPS